MRLSWLYNPYEGIHRARPCATPPGLWGNPGVSVSYRYGTSNEVQIVAYKDVGRPLGLPGTVEIGDFGMFSHAVRCAGKKLKTLKKKTDFRSYGMNIMIRIIMIERNIIVIILHYKIELFSRIK